MKFLKRALRDLAETRRQARLEQARADRKRVKRQYKAIFAELTQAFFEADPVGTNFEETRTSTSLRSGRSSRGWGSPGLQRT
jgi:hypothetical protein